MRIAQSVVTGDRIMVEVELQPGIYAKCPTTVIERTGSAPNMIHLTTADYGEYVFTPYTRI